jgi:hypothetical protein
MVVVDLSTVINADADADGEADADVNEVSDDYNIYGDA